VRPEEHALWREVARTAKPFPGRRLDEPAPANAEPVRKAPLRKAAMPAPAPHPVAAATPKAPPLAPLDKRMRTRLARGSVEIDSRIDLHGLTQQQAHERLARFIAAAQARGDRLVLVVTGKGKRQQDEPFAPERGILRRSVPHWLAAPDLRRAVVGFEEAHPVHGGVGALYVRIRRPRQ
jgi:DNA-nicking Smr family endonuclease